MGSEKFCLRWNDFERSISSAFKELFDNKDFFDVTLACDDNQIQAHKVILSACSPFFRNILRRNPHQHPILYLKGVKYTDLQSVLNFMYHGEVNVAQEELNSFLAVAEDLRVKGLTQNQPEINTKRESYSPKPKSRQVSKDHITHTKKAPQQSFTNSNNHSDHSAEKEVQEVVPVKSEPRDPPPPPQIATTPQAIYQGHLQAASQNIQALATPDDQTMVYQEGEYEDYEQYEGGTEEQEMVMEGNKEHRQKLNECILKAEENGSTVFKCVLCGKTSPRRDTVANHVENIHFPGSYQCNYCDQVFNSQNTKNVHVGRKHKYT